MVDYLVIFKLLSEMEQSMVIPKCCDVGYVYSEVSRKCEPGHFSLEDLHVFDLNLTSEVNANFSFDPGALKVEDCPNGTRRYHLQKYLFAKVLILL